MWTHTVVGVHRKIFSDRIIHIISMSSFFRHFSVIMHLRNSYCCYTVTNNKTKATGHEKVHWKQQNKMIDTES